MNQTSEPMMALRSTLGGAVRLARRSMDRVLHASRRDRARARIARLQPRRVLVMCHGNICRSPFAAARLTALVESVDGALVTSAGFIKPGRPSPDQAIAAAARRGIDMTAHRSRVVTEEDARTHDLIIVMDTLQARRLQTELDAAADNIVVLGDLDPQAIEMRTIRDPEGCDAAVFNEVYDRIELCISELASALRARSRA